MNMSFRDPSVGHEPGTAFAQRTQALHEIHAAIGRARRRPRIRISYTWLPEHKTWYECTRCGGEAYREDSRGKHCRLCAGSMQRREWVRPDIARAEHRAADAGAGRAWHALWRRPWAPPGDDEYVLQRRTPGGDRDEEVTWTNPWTPLPEGNYIIRRRTPLARAQTAPER
jgi:hypothetical protein